MKLWEYESALDSVVDPETGEINEEQANALWEDRDTRVEQFARWIKNQEAEAEALKAEEKRLAERRKVLENAASRGRAYIQRILDGSKFWCTAASISYRTVKAVEIANNAALIRWAEETGNDQILKLKEPEISKTELKRLLEADGPVKVPEELAQIVTRQSMQIK